jgi:hypothetical protein
MRPAEMAGTINSVVEGGASRLWWSDKSSNLQDHGIYLETEGK